MGRVDFHAFPDNLSRALRRLRQTLHLPSAALGFVALLIVVGFAGAVGGPAPQPTATQPVAFNHRLHVQDLELACDECHVFYETETFSGLPSTEQCALCHEEAQTENPEEAKLVEHLAAGSLEWEPLFDQPSHVFYSHRRHVVVAGMECAECHGDFAALERPPQQVERLTMDDCLGCHETHQAGVNCTDCHR